MMRLTPPRSASAVSTLAFISSARACSAAIGTLQSVQIQPSTPCAEPAALRFGRQAPSTSRTRSLTHVFASITPVTGVPGGCSAAVSAVVTSPSTPPSAMICAAIVVSSCWLCCGDMGGTAGRLAG